ncbi:MAG: entericidin, EcnA/B family [Boseongicola sp.]|nr:entericidin, EcnA/B family [Boseongicola sp.]MDD9976334.1 entericidin, EcnA/B family [Boseongicola sp.]
MTRTLMIISALVALSACNTVEGLGEDISDGARAVNRAF